jgi:3-deoxy-D-manno-octulosonate 8-phosphate phosphatase (KDO 8-P phosphatase)
MRERAKKIKAILVDVDGVLTDGGLYYDNNGNEFKKFNVKDGQIVKFLRENMIILGVITGRDSKVVDRRIEELRFDFYRKGVDNKEKVFNEFLNIYSLSEDEVSYIGDDIIDIKILRRVGFSGTPSDSREYIKNIVHFVTKSKGGEGAFRDFADYILDSKELLENIVK